ncbi:hypothetical protein PISMIDRAFT_555311 [Pisolithus microcarpus 441]|uniref:Uncharacterized protein n=1 Tax=Pisolithus microcarpus 441 TaxID=765257 RepID=A0A0D0AA20_9AGAM|nr:hypothetical protein PISMIDRAFT_555311 [Pisolithus microcarpus 441]
MNPRSNFFFSFRVHVVHAMYRFISQPSPVPNALIFSSSYSFIDQPTMLSLTHVISVHLSLSPLNLQTHDLMPTSPRFIWFPFFSSRLSMLRYTLIACIPPYIIRSDAHVPSYFPFFPLRAGMYLVYNIHLTPIVG